MPQGFKKGKSKLAEALNKKKPSKNKGHNSNSVTRKNRPIQPKKTKCEEVQRLKKIITKNVNRAIEEQVRGIACDNSKIKLSKKRDQKDKMPQLTAENNKMPPKQT